MSIDDEIIISDSDIVEETPNVVERMDEDSVEIILDDNTDNDEEVIIDLDSSIDVSQEEFVAELETPAFSDRSFYINDEDFELQVQKPKSTELTSLADNVSYTNKSIIGQVGSLTRALSDVSFNNYRDKSVSKLIKNTSATCPDFIRDGYENIAYQAILNMSPNDDLRTIYNNLGLPEAYVKDEIKYKLYEDWSKIVYESVQKEAKLSSYLSNLKGQLAVNVEKYIPSFINEFFKIGPHLQNNTLEVFTKFISDGEKLTHFVCPKCGKEELVPNEFVKMLYADTSFEVLYKPLLCSCGTLCILDKKHHKKLRQAFRPYYDKMKPVKVHGNALRAYTPDGSVLLAMFYNLLDVEVNISDTSLDTNESFNDYVNLDVDWDKSSKEFLDFINMVYSSKYKVSKDSNYIHNCAKILCQSHDYPSLKESALSSLVLALEELDLFRFSLKTKNYLNIYSSITDISNMPQSSIDYLVDSLGVDVVVDKKIDLDLVKKSLSVMKERNDSFENDLVSYIENLKENKYLLSFIHVSDISLREDLIYNYFYDERLVKVLDEISDLMILNYLAEDTFRDLNVSYYDSSSKRVSSLSSLTRAKKNLMNLNKSDKFIDSIESICDSVVDGNIDIYKFLIVGFRDSDSINDLASFYDACYRGDVYDMNLYHKRIEDKISEGSHLPSSIVNSILDFPAVEIKTDKFDFYFDFECDRGYKAKFVNLYKDKKFVPVELKGDTVDEKLEYYISCTEDSCEVKQFIDKTLKSYLENFESVYNYGKFINYSNLFGDYISYMFMRDLLFYSSYNGIGTALTLSSLDPEVASVLLEDDFQLPTLDPNVVNDFALLCLPYSNSDLLEIQQSSLPYSVRIKSLFNSIDFVRYDSQILGLEGIVDSLLGTELNDNSSS